MSSLPTSESFNVEEFTDEELSNLIILTEDQFRDIVGTAVEKAVDESVQVAVADERERFAEINKDSQLAINNLIRKNNVLLGVSIGTGSMALLSTIILIFQNIVKR